MVGAAGVVQVVGILGGSAGTTYDAFHMLWEAKKHGARAALYDRKINNSEHQLTSAKYLRAVADDQIGPEKAVRAYHADLKGLGIQPDRSLPEDLQRTAAAASYGGSGSRPQNTFRPARPSSRPAEEPDFSKMTPAEKAKWSIEKWRQILG